MALFGDPSKQFNLSNGAGNSQEDIAKVHLQETSYTTRYAVIIRTKLSAWSSET